MYRRPMNATDIARACHEINRAYCSAIGDNTQLAWDESPEWQRTSAVNGVHFHLANPEASPSASHESWWAEKKVDGWTYGPKKDPAKKQHPCCVPYEQLPAAQRAKDYIFSATVRELRRFL